METKKAVSLVLLNEHRKTLFALRSEDNTSYPNNWSLPSHFMKDNETFNDTVKRVGKNKLDCQLKLLKLLKNNKFQRDRFVLDMYVFLVEVEKGTPRVNTPKYSALKWEFANKQFKLMKEFGACTTLYKEFLEENEEMS